LRLRLTTRALQRRAEDRWQSAAQFRDALDEWISRTTKIGTRDLAAFVGKVINAPTADLEGVPRAMTNDDEDKGLSGPMTRMSIARAEADADAPVPAVQY